MHSNKGVKSCDPIRTQPAPKRDLIDLSLLAPDHLLALLDLAAALKRGDVRGRPLAGRCLAMIFRKSSTRTRVSTEAGMVQLGGHAIMISDRDSQMGRGESVSDTARVLSRYVDAILIRTFAHDEVVRMARAAAVPVINGLTDLLHPCQVLADLLTAKEEYGSLEGMRVAWIGDGNNMANSWINASERLGFDLALACPPGYEPDRRILERALSGDSSTVSLADSPADAAQGAHVVTTDVWASMGQEDETNERAAAFSGYQVDAELMAGAHASSIFLHCLPAHRGEEVTAEVMDGPRSRVWREAENRLHVVKAVLLDVLDAAPGLSPARGTKT